MQILADENLDINEVTRAEVEDVLSQLDLGDSLMSICNTKRDSCYFSKKINALRVKRIRDQKDIDDEDERSRRAKSHKSESRSTETRFDYLSNLNTRPIFASKCCSFPGCPDKFPPISLITPESIKDCRHVTFENQIEIIYSLQLLTGDLNIFYDGSVFCKLHSSKIKNQIYLNHEKSNSLEKIILIKSRNFEELRSNQSFSGSDSFVTTYVY
jgi:hypothetical protein